MNLASPIPTRGCGTAVSTRDRILGTAAFIADSWDYQMDSEAKKGRPNRSPGAPSVEMSNLYVRLK